MIRIYRKRCIEACKRFSVALQPKKCDSPFGKGVSILGSNGKYTVENGNCGFLAAKINESIAMVLSRLKIRRLDANRLLVLRDRFLKAT